MSAAQHTPGPWTVAEWTARDKDGAIDGGGYQVVDAEGYLISACTTEGANETEEANARLIAAAPELLAALRDLELSANSLQYCFDRRPENFGVALTQLAADAKHARAAIAKATGSAA